MACGAGGRTDGRPSRPRTRPARGHRADRSWRRCLAPWRTCAPERDRRRRPAMAEASRLRCRWRCHLPVASMTTSAMSRRDSQRLSWRMPAQRISHAQPFAGGQHVGVEPAFADIDPHARLGLGLLFGRFLALHAGRAPYHLLRTRAEGRTDHAPPRCQTPRGNLRSRPSASGPVATGPDAPCSLR